MSLLPVKRGGIGEGYYLGITFRALFISSRMLSNCRDPNNTAAFLEQQGGSTKISTLNRGCWVPYSTDKSTRHVSSRFTAEFLSNRCVHFGLHRSSCLCSPPLTLLEVGPSVPNICSFPRGGYLIAWEKEFGGEGGGGKGSDLEELLGWTFPSILPSPTSPVLPNQLLLAVRRPPMISSSKADVGLGGWSVGCGRLGGWRVGGKGEERGPANGFDQNAAWRKA